METQLPSPQKKGGTAHIVGPCLLWPNGRPSQLLLSTFTITAELSRWWMAIHQPVISICTVYSLKSWVRSRHVAVTVRVTASPGCDVLNGMQTSERTSRSTAVERLFVPITANDRCLSQQLSISLSSWPVRSSAPAGTHLPAPRCCCCPSRRSVVSVLIDVWRHRIAFAAANRWTASCWLGRRGAFIDKRRLSQKVRTSSLTGWLFIYSYRRCRSCAGYWLNFSPVSVVFGTQKQEFAVDDMLWIASFCMCHSNLWQPKEATALLKHAHINVNVTIKCIVLKNIYTNEIVVK